MVQCDQWLRYRRALVLSEGILLARGLRLGRRVGAERGAIEYAERDKELEPDALWHA